MPKFSGGIVYQAFDNRLRIKLDVAVSSSQLDLAKILVQLNYVYEVINKSRKKVGIDNLIPFVEFINNGPYDNEAALTSSLTIVQHYSLPKEWASSFYVAIFTNTLPVPPDSDIRVILPKKLNHGLGGITNNLNREFVSDSDSIIIEIPTKISVESIRSFLSKNKNNLDKYLELLPASKHSQTEQRVMLIGQAAEFVLQDDSRASWPDVLRELKRIWTDFDKPPVVLPDVAEELRKIHERYLRTLKSISDSSS